MTYGSVLFADRRLDAARLCSAGCCVHMAEFGWKEEIFDDIIIDVLLFCFFITVAASFIIRIDALFVVGYDKLLPVISGEAVCDNTVSGGDILYIDANATKQMSLFQPG